MTQKSLQTSFAAGILDPDMEEREDYDARYAGASDILNMVVKPQGGLILRDGLAYRGRVRGKLTPIDLASATITLGGQSSGGALADPPSTQDQSDSDPASYDATSPNAGFSGGSSGGQFEEIN